MGGRQRLDHALAAERINSSRQRGHARLPCRRRAHMLHAPFPAALVPCSWRRCGGGMRARCSCWRRGSMIGGCCRQARRMTSQCRRGMHVQGSRGP